MMAYDSSRIALVLVAAILIVAIAATACSDGESGAAVGQPPPGAADQVHQLKALLLDFDCFAHCVHVVS